MLVFYAALPAAGAGAGAKVSNCKVGDVRWAWAPPASGSSSSDDAAYPGASKRPGVAAADPPSPLAEAAAAAAATWERGVAQRRNHPWILRTK